MTLDRSNLASASAPLVAHTKSWPELLNLPVYVTSLPSAEMLKWGLRSSLFHRVGNCMVSLGGGAIIAPRSSPKSLLARRLLIPPKLGGLSSSELSSLS